MKTNVVLKLVSLCALLVALLLATAYIKSEDFKKQVNMVFGIGAPKAYTWCPDHAIDFEWQDEQFKNKFKDLSPDQQAKKFCSLTLEPITGLDLTQIEFKPLLKVQSAEAKVAVLEWNPENRVFKANGLPFSSTYLGREILDK